MSVRQLVVRGAVLLPAACRGPQPPQAMSPAEPSDAVQVGGPSTGAGTSNAGIREQAGGSDHVLSNPAARRTQAGFTPSAFTLAMSTPKTRSVDVGGSRRKRSLPRKSARSARHEHIASTNERAETRPE